MVGPFDFPSEFTILTDPGEEGRTKMDLHRFPSKRVTETENGVLMTGRIRCSFGETTRELPLIVSAAVLTCSAI
jgi:hypothetical protein